MPPLRLDQYIAQCTIINCGHETILQKASQLACGSNSKLEIAKRCFYFVRDEIKHSWDYQTGPVTLTAADVLHHGTGFCYAKSHLLAALLRANQIPTGLCYQRLTIENNQPPFCLHGLNAIWFEEFGWYRVDARGNNKNVSADFCPPKEQLAFPIVASGEIDLPEIWPSPINEVIHCLTRYPTIQEVAAHLPDIPLINNK